ncbi:hypothetical protein ACTXKB_14020 [Psychrobacter aquimaris]|uniref:hypothetical protein n=1 Tax=Psychrobacter aquimaris TaxID=292733 RepID=UPI003FD28E82
MHYQAANNLKYVFSSRITEKLETKHGVTQQEVKQCFNNSSGVTVEDTREEHATNPPTQWFIAITDSGRELKVVFIYDEEEEVIYVKTAFKANETNIVRFNKASI